MAAHQSPPTTSARRWPQVSAWTGALWRLLSEELARPSSPHTDPELDEVGESG